MRKFSNKSHTGNRNTYFAVHNFFLNRAFYEIMWKQL